MKKLPSLIDRIAYGHPNSVQHVKQISPVTQRFVFSDDSSAFLGKFIRECGDMILQNRQFALPPYPRTYVELNLDLMIKAIGAQSSVDIQPGVDSESRIGYLLDGNHVYVIVPMDGIKNDQYSVDPDAAMITPFEYLLNTPGHSEPFFNFHNVVIDNKDQKWLELLSDKTGLDRVTKSIRMQKDEWVRTSLFLGTTLHQLDDEVMRSDILNSIRVVSTIPVATNDQSFVQGSFGDIRNVWAALLLINQPNKNNISLTKESPKSGIVKGKRRVLYAAHTTVHINVDGRRNLRKLFKNNLGGPKRRHRVRRSFRDYHTTIGCAHDWPILPDFDKPYNQGETMRWTCSKCGGWRTWKVSYERGDASKGYVTKDYSV